MRTQTGLLLLLASLGPACHLAFAGLEITASPTPLAPPKGSPAVLVHHAQDNKGSNTS